MRGDVERLNHEHKFVPERGNMLVQCVRAGCGLFLAEAVAGLDLSPEDRQVVVDSEAERIRKLDEQAVSTLAERAQVDS